jgi:hypothetical protein
MPEARIGVQRHVDYLALDSLEVLKRKSGPFRCPLLSQPQSFSFRAKILGQPTAKLSAQFLVARSPPGHGRTEASIETS